MIPYTNILQNSEEWEQMRRIRPTASRFSEIITATKGDLSDSAKPYAIEIVTQQLFSTNPDQGWAGNVNTDNGHDREPAAREAFTLATGLPVELIGFCTTDDGFAGCSPDFMIRGPGGEYISGGELKCPLAKTHSKYLLEGVLPKAYVQQVHGSMYVTGLHEWRFVSYFPSLPLFEMTVHWDAYTDKLARAMDDFRILYAQVRRELAEKLKPSKAA